ncbi:hypothetical protein B296_00017132 [Ensete ventricosum]|uniref:Uncharacterized protein n=1 Tax=Ensete ventricosum TaxID=4639 RepID=A0A426YL33_ENSVE|nr:hypothetical protein B296_00017132 [Ensete ventricosum]
MIVDFDGDVSLAKKETIMLEPSSKIRLDRTIMPLYDQALVKDINLELMPINLTEGDCYVINHGKGLMVVDFGDYLEAAMKRLKVVVGGWEHKAVADNQGCSPVSIGKESRGCCDNGRVWRRDCRGGRRRVATTVE